MAKRAFFDPGDEQTGEPALENKIKNNSKDVADYLWLGKIYLDRGDYSNVIPLCNRALNLSLTHEERAQIIYEKGQALSLLGNEEEAISCYEQALQLLLKAEDSALVLEHKGAIHYHLSLFYSEGREREHATLALEELKQLMNKYSDYEEKSMVYSYIADLYSRLNEFDEAMEAYKKALEEGKDDDEKMWCLVGIASIYWNKGDRKKSEETYKQALKIAKENKFLSKIYFDMGKMYFEANGTSEAIDSFNHALKYREYDPALRYNKAYLGEILWHLGTLAYDRNDYDEAIKYLIKTLENINENHAYYCNTHITLGHCYFVKGYYNKAQEHYNTALFSPLAREEEISMANECLKQIEKEKMT